MKNPLVSIVVPCKNSSSTLEDCLKSCKINQSYKNIELIVVDNFSTDNTPEISKKYADKFIQAGPERSAQRNIGVKNSTGEIVIIIDSDMILSQDVVLDAVKKFEENEKVESVIIPEESFGNGFWAKCKKLERSYYLNVPWIEGSRVFKRETYLKVGGYDEKYTGVEDWDLSQRIGELGKVERINSFIYHNEGNLSLKRTLYKKYYYAKGSIHYLNNSTSKNTKYQTSVLQRYKLYFKNPIQIIKHPITWFGMIFMKTLEFLFGGVGLVYGKIRLWKFL